MQFAKKQSKHFKKLILSGLLFSVTATSYSAKFYLCGPSEDGCYAGIYSYCFCIPEDREHSPMPYCLDFDNLSCNPLKNSNHCNPQFIYPNKGQCLAVIFQSIATPACKLVQESFCKQHKSYFCDVDGRLSSCKK